MTVITFEDAYIREKLVAKIVGVTLRMYTHVKS